MMLGEFYCATFDAPVMAEIRRAGVVYARVYDIRGRSFPSLLTMPGPLAGIGRVVATVHADDR